MAITQQSPDTPPAEPTPAVVSPPEIPERIGKYIRLAPACEGVVHAYLYSSGVIDAAGLRQLAHDANIAAVILDDEEAKLRALYEGGNNHG